MIPIRYNVRNLFTRWLTSLLTAAGFMLVVGLLTVMLAFVEGLNALSKKTGPEGNIILLQDGTTDELFSGILVEDAKTAVDIYGSHPLLARENGQPLLSLEVYTIATQEVPPKEPGGRPTYRFLQVRGVDDPVISGKVHGLALAEGRWFGRSGAEVVMGEGIARTLGVKLHDQFNPRPEIGWTVVGIMSSKGSPFDSEIWGKRENIGRDFGRDNEERKQSFYTSAVVSTLTADSSAAEKVAQELRNKSDRIRVNAMTERKYYEEMSKSNQMFLTAAVFIAIIMAAGGMFGLMNTMFAAVSARTKDIGVLRILGYRRWQILLCFLLESLLLAVLGGALGLALGALADGRELTSFVGGQGGGGKTVVFEMIVNAYVIQMGVGFTLVMGFLGGLVPAWSAMRIRPLESLR